MQANNSTIRRKVLVEKQKLSLGHLREVFVGKIIHITQSEAT